MILAAPRDAVEKCHKLIVQVGYWPSRPISLQRSGRETT